MKNFYLKAILLISFFVLFSKYVNAQTYVSGHLTSNTTWTLGNSPYIVLDTLTVDPGLSLTIEPGVTVKVENGKPIKLNKANLIAVGSITDSIIFTTNYPIVSQGNWAGINIYPDNNFTTFLNEKIKYCRIDHAQNGLTYFPQSSIFDTLLIKNSTFSSNSNGLEINDATNMSIDSCAFLYSVNIGLVSSSCRSLTVKNCNFEDNLEGIFSSNDDYSIITDCSIRNSSVMGIATDNGYNSTIQSCIINHNGTGINGSFGWKVVKCTLDSNGTAVYSQGLSEVLGCNIRNNYSGIQDNFINLLISKNLIENDSIGIYLNANDSIFCNKICNNYIYSLMVDEANPLSYNLSNNDWCTSDTALISASINYGSGAFGYPVVVLLPIDTVQCYQSPCNLIISESTTNATCPTCADGRSTAHVFNGFQPYTYSWNTSPAQTLLTAVNLLPGNYTVCATDIYGCSACDNFAVLSGSCSAYFNFYADTVPHSYLVQNLAHGTGGLTYSWDWGDGSPFDVTAFPSHTYATPGFYTICQTITDATGCSNQYCNTYSLQRSTNTVIYVNVIGGTTTGISENAENDFVLYPNPASGSITIMLPDNKANSNLKIYNLIGDVETQVITTKQKSIIDISHLTSGIYIMEVKYEGVTMRKKFVRE